MKTINVYDVDMRKVRKELTHDDICKMFEYGYYLQISEWAPSLELCLLGDPDTIQWHVNYWFDSKEKDRGVSFIGPFSIEDVERWLRREGVSDSGNSSGL